MKIIGSLLIIFGAIISSFFYEKKLKQEINFMESLYDFVLFTKSKIEYFGKTKKQIISEYTSKTGLLNKILIEGNNCELNFIDDNTKNDILSFFDSIGKGFKKEEIDLCNYTLKIIEASKEKMKSEYTKKAKLFRSLSLFLSLGCVILLV